MIRRIGRLLEPAVSPPLAAWALLRVGWWLLRARQRLAQAEQIVVMHEGGFGHTLMLPDVMRRLSPGRRLVLIVFERTQHNALVGQLWPDVHVLFLPFRWTVGLGRWRRQLHLSSADRRRIGGWLIQRLRGWTHAEVISSVELYNRVLPVRYIPALMEPPHTSCWMAGWAVLLQERPAAPARLPEAFAGPVRAEIARFCGRPAGALGPVCCLYVREKGVSSVDVSSLSRSAGPMAHYWPLIERLVSGGWLVLLTGDRRLPAAEAERLGHRVVCAPWLCADERAYSLFAHTECDLWIGQQAGPCVLPVINDIPMLVVDGFPFGNALPGALMHYKTVRGRDDGLVPAQTLFEEYGYEYGVSGLQCNSAQQLLDAAEEFLAAPQRPRELAAAGDPALVSLPDSLLTKHVGCRLSRAWLRLFEAGAAERPPQGSVAVAQATAR